MISMILTAYVLFGVIMYLIMSNMKDLAEHTNSFIDEHSETTLGKIGNHLWYFGAVILIWPIFLGALMLDIKDHFFKKDN